MLIFTSVKIPPRVYAPALLALLLASMIGGLFLWQIHNSVRTIESSFRAGTPGSLMKKILADGSDIVVDSATQSEALMELRQGEIFELKGLWKQSEDRYLKSVESGGGAPALKKLASIQLQRREYDAARQTINTLKDEQSDNADVMFLEGVLALRQGDLGTASSVFGRQAESPQGLYGQALVSIAKGDDTAARPLLTQAAQGGDPDIRFAATTLLQAMDEFALFPNGQPIHLSTLMAHALAEVNECETALKLVTPVVIAEPKYRDAWIVKGFCEFNTERAKEALASLEQAYSLDPGKPEIQYFLARTHAALGDPQNAVTFLHYAILNGFQPERDARELLAEYAMELGNTDLALEQYKIVAEGPDGDLAAYRRYIDLAVGTQNNSLDALGAAKNALVRWPDDASALTLAAKAALSAGLPDEALRYIANALKINPTDKDSLAVQEAINQAGQPTD